MVAFARRVARRAKGPAMDRLQESFKVRAGLLCVGMAACGVFLAVHGPQHETVLDSNALGNIQGGLERAPAGAAYSHLGNFELDVMSTSESERARLLLLKDGVEPSGFDDDAVVYNSETNPTGQRTCKSNDQEDICRGWGADSCKRLVGVELFGLIPVVLGLLYLFVGIATVCDELFVPSLEIIAEDLKLSADVAGATLMAAGGSAPELATSFVGAFQRSDVGFGTIVGSAVFNVLFVIGCCAMYTPAEFQPLPLTWWPLARDCTYYVLTLVTLVIFMADAEIMWWEALIQFALYFGYVFLMSQSEKLEKVVKNWLSAHKVHSVGGQGMAERKESNGVTTETELEAAIEKDANLEFTKPTTFRTSIMQVLATGDLGDKFGIALVAKVKGDASEVWAKVDKAKSNQLEFEEVRTMLINQLGFSPEQCTDDEVMAMVKAMDTDGTGKVSREGFVQWYAKSEQRIKAQTRTVFNKFDADQSGDIDAVEIKKLLEALGNAPSEKDLAEALVVMGAAPGDMTAKVTFAAFEKWYQNSLFWTQQKAAGDEVADQTQSMWDGTKDGFKDLSNKEVPFQAKFVFILTLPIALFLSCIPDCRPPGQEKKAALTFFGSIFAIAVFAILMVELATIFGDSVGIPQVVMGLTVLAAGTSVPDLLSSVIVAKQGLGDMAVSSSIGSNIFDVAFGLPVPWLLFAIVTGVNDCNCGVMVQAEGLVLSLVVLLLMVIAIVVAIAAFDWKMTKNLGRTMFALYFMYVAFALLNTPASDYVVATCPPGVDFAFRPI